MRLSCFLLYSTHEAASWLSRRLVLFSPKLYMALGGSASMEAWKDLNLPPHRYVRPTSSGCTLGFLAFSAFSTSAALLNDRRWRKLPGRGLAGSATPEVAGGGGALSSSSSSSLSSSGASAPAGGGRLVLSSTRLRRSLGEGRRPDVSNSPGSRRSRSPSVVRRISAMRACCSKLQWFSTERMTGKGLVRKPYSLMASTTAANWILPVSVWPW
mmetsp:Transcript_16249/g.55183  ORF Transcript_16249/g.55183 Transcript_16249/m.55183 type:complete len:213 (-) Transcript_16249:1140-1778(-)